MDQQHLGGFSARDLIIADNTEESVDLSPLEALHNSFIAICAAIKENPRDTGPLEALRQMSHRLEDVQRDVIEMVESTGFFALFSTQIVCPAEDPRFVRLLLPIVEEFCRFHTSVCLTMLQFGVGVWLGKFIFCNDAGVREGVIECLALLVKDSMESRHFLLSSVGRADIVVDLAALVNTPPNRATELKVLEILSDLVYVPETFIGQPQTQALIRVAERQIKHGEPQHVARLLSQIAINVKHFSPVFAKEGFFRAIMESVQKDDKGKHVMMFMKFFMIRSEYEEEARALFQSGIVDLVAELLSKSTESAMMKWCCFVISNVIQKVPEAVCAIFDRGIFASVVDAFSPSGSLSFDGKAAVGMLLITLLAQKDDIRILEDPGLMEVMRLCLELLPSASPLVVTRIIRMSAILVRREQEAGRDAFIKLVRECAAELECVEDEAVQAIFCDLSALM